MKILQVYKNYYPVLGGIENNMRMLCAEFARRGHEVTALVANAGPGTVREVIEGVQVIRAGSLGTAARAPLSPLLFWEMARLRPDITHLQFPYPIGELAHLLLGRARHTVISYQSDIVRQRTLLRLYEPLLWRSLAHADRIIANNPNYVRTSPYLSRVAAKCVVVPIGVDIQRFRQPDPTAVARLRQLYGQPLILFVGLFRYYKGLEYLIAALRDVPARLVLVGSGPLEAALRSQVQREGLADKVHFAGAVSDADLPSYYHACDVFVLPSSHRSEAYGIVQIEAMACEKTVISTELGTGTSYVNLDGITGLVVPPRDPAALSAALNRLLGDGALRRRLAHAGAERAWQEFSKETMFERVETIYRQLVGDL